VSQMLPLPRLSADADAPFPPVALALDEPNGLLAFGGDLSPTRLLNAYSQGIFPWYSNGQPILWWSPDPRMVIAPGELHLSRRFRRELRRCAWQLAVNTRFAEIIGQCAEQPRPGQYGTWITAEMRAAYLRLHRLGHAHSVEVLDGGDLVGGIYGIAIGRMFFGESMVSLRPGGSKVAIAALCRLLLQGSYVLLDGQVESPHLASLGFAPMPRSAFIAVCARACAALPAAPLWQPRRLEFTAAALATPA